MRITQNQIVNKPVNLETGKQDLAKNLVGKTIEGVVTAINGNKITLTQNGQLLNLINDSNTVFQTDQKVQLLVTGFTEGSLTATPVAQTSTEDAANQVLNRFGVVADAGNREIAEAMLKYDVPMTQENFNTMKQNLAAAKAFLNDLQMAPDKASLIDVEKTLKENVLNFIKFDQQVNIADKTVTQNSENNLISHSPLNDEALQLNTQNQSTSNQSVVQQLNQNTSEILVASKLGETQSEPVTNNSQLNILENEISKVDLIKPETIVVDKAIPQESTQANIINTDFVDTVKLQEGILKGLMRDLISTVFEKPSENFHEVAEKLVSLFDLEEDAIFTKNSLELNLKNLFVLNQLKLTEKSVGNGFFELSKIIEKSKLSKENFSELQNILNEKLVEDEKLVKVAQFVKDKTDDLSTKEKIDKEVMFIKDASQMTKQLNEPLFYMQVPFKIDDYERSVDLYYRKKKSSDDKDDFTILIALKTKNYEEVRCVIEKKKDQYILNFKLANEDIKNLFEKKSKALETQLEGRSYILKFSTQSHVPDAEMDIPKQSMIDLKI